eukprot:m.208655 g.208655  ORF g.208655 m.208655 type:complete len:149 (-) comp10132_c1_seq16:1188-1634(-)
MCYVRPCLQSEGSMRLRSAARAASASGQSDPPKALIGQVLLGQSNTYPWTNLPWAIEMLMNYGKHLCWEDSPLADDYPGNVLVYKGFVYKFYQSNTSCMPNVKLLRDIAGFTDAEVHYLGGLGFVMKYGYLQGSHIASHVQQLVAIAN